MTVTQQGRRGLTGLLAASTLSNLGDGVAKVAFPLLAVTVTRDPVLISGLVVTQMLPWLLFGALAGVVLDRVDRRRAMIAANTARAAGVGLLAGFVLIDAVSLPVVYAAALLVGTAETVADSAANVLVPAVVDSSRLESANSKLQSIEMVGQTLLGNPLGSLAFALLAALPFLLTSGMFGAAVVVLVLLLPGVYRPPERGVARPRNLRAELGEGLRWLRTSPLFARLVVFAALLGLTIEMAQAQLVLYALGDLRLPEAAFGLFVLAAGAGGILCALVSPALTRLFGRWPVLVTGFLVAGVACAGMGVFREPVLAAVLFAALGGAVISVNVVVATLRHVLIPDALLGRVLGVWRTVVWGAIPVGALLGGVFTRLLGTPSRTFVLSGACVVAVGVIAGIVLRRFRVEINSATAAAA